MPVSPIQTRFDGGETTPRSHGRFDTDLYKRSLSYMKAFAPAPQGSMSKRAGFRSMHAATAERQIPFELTDGTSVSVSLYDELLSVAAKEITGMVAGGFRTNLLANGAFHAGYDGWTLNGSAENSWVPGGYMRIGDFQQDITLAAGTTYVLRFRARNLAAGVNVLLRRAALATGDVVNLTGQWADYEYTFNDGCTLIRFTPHHGAGVDPSALVEIDDILLYADGVAAISTAAPWTADEVAAVQYDQDITKNQMMLVHPNHPPYLLSRYSDGTWELIPAPFLGAPNDWVGSNYPAVIEWGFQGRLWLGATPATPNVFNGSKSGFPFDFTIGENPNDGLQFNASVRGGIKWMQGQKSLLMGAAKAEQAAHGSGQVIAPNNIQVENESAFGSAALQAAHLGDEVVFVGKNRNEVRALAFDGQVKNGWVSKALSYLGEHMVRGIKEVHFARMPDPTVFVLLDDGQLVACVYDRVEQVTAWWRVGNVTSIHSAMVMETQYGAEVWALVDRADGRYCEIMPTYDVGSLETTEETELGPIVVPPTVYLDGWARVTVGAAGLVDFLDRFPDGTDVSVVRASTNELLFRGPVVGGQVTITDPPAPGTPIYVGASYTATARLLPRDLKSGKAHSPKLGVLIHKSAIPKLNDRRPGDRASAAVEGEPEPLRSGKFEVSNLGWSDDDVITIEQELPYRTEVLAVYARTQANEV